jgi:penicillin-binding protein-related factor A (putative recombinase)
VSKKQSPGDWAEAEVQKWLDKETSRLCNFAYHRYPDARAARGALAAQPADYLVSNGTICHLEVKETEQINRLPKKKIRQYGMLLKWKWAGVTPFVVIYRSEAKDWVYLSSDQLFEFEECPPSFDLSKRPTYATCGDIMNWLFA